MTCLPVYPVPQPAIGRRAAGLQPAHGMTAQTVPHPVLDLPPRLLHQVQRLCLAPHYP